MSEKEKKLEREYWVKIQEARKYRIDLEQIVKKDKIRQESTRKIIKSAQIALDNIEFLEGACEMYKRHKMIRITSDYILKYYISTFKKYMTDNK
jgi:hypothetical protein|tara:strand:+ start:794 stop:1075 length:282 start_codon:yes stop_codon:yes gene_type:complete